MVTFISHIEVFTQTHTDLEGSQAPSFNDTRNTEPRNFPNLPKAELSPVRETGGCRAGSPCQEGMRYWWAAPHSTSLAGASGNLLESSLVVVDRFDVTALVFQKVGIVVVHLGVVG